MGDANNNRHIRCPKYLSTVAYTSVPDTVSLLVLLAQDLLGARTREKIEIIQARWPLLHHLRSPTLQALRAATAPRIRPFQPYGFWISPFVEVSANPKEFALLFPDNRPQGKSSPVDHFAIRLGSSVWPAASPLPG